MKVGCLTSDIHPGHTSPSQSAFAATINSRIPSVVTENWRTHSPAATSLSRTMTAISAQR